MQNLETVRTFVQQANAFHIDEILALFAPDAIIDDESVGAKFTGAAGVRQYLERYFVGYHTKTVVVSLEPSGDAVLAQVDFSGDFGHETGRLNFRFGSDGSITSVQASLD